MELRVGASPCCSSLQACRPCCVPSAPRVSAVVVRRPPWIGVGLQRTRFRGLGFGGTRRSQGLVVVRVYGSKVASGCLGDEENLSLEKDCAERVGGESESKGIAEVRAFLAATWGRVQVVGWLAVVALGIGATAATASAAGVKPDGRPCFASVSSVSDKGQKGGADSGAITTTEEREQGSSGEKKEQEQQPGESRDVDVKDVEIVGHEDDGFDEYGNVEGEGAESDGDVGSDDEGMGYPTIGELEDLDELGELGEMATDAAAAELLSESGEIDSAEAEGEKGDTEDEGLRKAFEEWKSKPYALTVPLRIVGLRGSVPPAWLKEFLMSQGKNAKVSAEFKGSLSAILADLAKSMENNQVTPKSTMAADLVTVGDSWLATAVQAGLIEPIRNAEHYEWFQRLHPKWQNFLRRDNEGVLDPNGLVWGVPYRWGSLVFAFRKDKLEKNGIAPIKDWKDLFQPQLAGRVAMVESPREVVGAVLKSLGASYNSTDFDAEVPGGKDAVKDRFVALQKQVRLFDDNDYLKAMGAGDAWVAVGWSSDIIPYSKRASNISVYAPESGTSLWADLWGIPATTAFEESENIGGRVRGPSPLVFQWLDFCLQPARASTFVNDVFVGASPLALSEKTGAESVESLVAATPPPPAKEEPVVKMDTNIVQGMPPDDVVAKSEFLEPLNDKGLTDYQWLLSESLDVEGWPSSFTEFVKGIALTLMEWRHPKGSRG